MHGACQKKFALFQLVDGSEPGGVGRQAGSNRSLLPAVLAAPGIGFGAAEARRGWVEDGISLRHSGRGIAFRFHEMLTITFIHCASAVGPEAGPLG